METVEFYGKATLGGVLFPDTPLKTVILHEDTVVTDGAFSGCTQLVSIDFTKIVGIGTDAFKGCTSIKEADLSKLKYAVGNGNESAKAFDGCTSLGTLIVPINIDLRNFDTCTALKSITLTKGDGTAFDYSGPIDLWKNISGCTLTMSPDVKVIGNYTFAGWDGVTSVDYSDFERIGDYAYSGCPNLTKVRISGDVKLGEGVFSDCAALTDADLGIKTIPSSFFDGCPLLKNLTGT